MYMQVQKMLGVIKRGKSIYCSACGQRVGVYLNKLYILPGCIHLVAHFVPYDNPKMPILRFYAVAESKVKGGFLLLLPRPIVEKEWQRN